MDSENLTRRRGLARFGAAGIGAFAGTRVFGTQSKQEPMTTEQLQDPKTKYPKPPFKEQSQPSPGLASKMETRPEQGEESYKASGRWSGRTATSTGGESATGAGGALASARDGRG